MLAANERLMFLTCKSSMHTIALLWLMVAVALCRKSWRRLPMWACTGLGLLLVGNHLRLRVLER